jgi:hypothetical protein
MYDQGSPMLTTVHRAFNPADAQLVRSRLEAAQFHPVVTHELSALSLDGYSLAAGGILVQVPDAEAVEAREFLETSVLEGPDPQSEPPPGAG